MIIAYSGPVPKEESRMLLQPLGDQAWMAALADEEKAAAFAATVRAANPPWLMDVVQAYRTVAVFFDADLTRIATAEAWLREQALAATTGPAPPSRLHLIPCCYEMQKDMTRVVEHTGLPPDDVIRLHTAND